MGTVEIPTGKLDEGLALCAENIRRLVRDVHVLLQDSSVAHATVFAIIACEELAKHSELRKAKRSATADSVLVNELLFRGRDAHQLKQDLARKLVPEHVDVLAPAAFDDSHFNPEFFHTEDTEVSNQLRLDCLFVNWDRKGGKWVHGAVIEGDRLRKFVHDVLDALDDLESNLRT
jgi:AbiV family abortive infection protein